MNRTAIGRHIEYLALAWSRTKVPFDRIVLVSPYELQLDGLGDQTRVELRTIASRWPNVVWEQSILPRAARGAAVLFCEYSCPLLYQGPIVLCNHGIYEAAGQRETFTWVQRLRTRPLNKRSCRRADRVIANSIQTRRDLVKYFRVPESKVDIVYPAAADLFFEPKGAEAMATEVRNTLGQPAPFVIFVGKLSRRRNIPSLIAAFAETVRRSSLPHHLLIVGPNTSEVPLTQLIASNGANSIIHYVPHLEQRRLALLYAAAELYVLPSTYEGISWTMFEAMASRTAVLAVEHPALEEGGADAVMAVPSASVDDLMRGLTTLLTNRTLRESYRERGLARAKKFSLAECANATMDILDRFAARADHHELRLARA